MRLKYLLIQISYYVYVSFHFEVKTGKTMILTKITQYWQRILALLVGVQFVRDYDTVKPFSKKILIL